MNHLICHRKIHGSEITVVKKRIAKAHMTNFGFFKIALVKRTVDKKRAGKVGLTEIAIIEGAVLEFFPLNFVGAENSVFVCFVVDEIGSHFAKFPTNIR